MVFHLFQFVSVVWWLRCWKLQLWTWENLVAELRCFHFKRRPRISFFCHCPDMDKWLWHDCFFWTACKLQTRCHLANVVNLHCRFGLGTLAFSPDAFIGKFPFYRWTGLDIQQSYLTSLVFLTRDSDFWERNFVVWVRGFNRHQIELQTLLHIKQLNWKATCNLALGDHFFYCILLTLTDHFWLRFVLFDLLWWQGQRPGLDFSFPQNTS